MPLLEHVEMLRQREHRLHHVQVVDARRVDGDERLREEVGLLLVVAFEADAVAGPDHRLEQRDDARAASTTLPAPTADAAFASRSARAARFASQRVRPVIRQSPASRP